MDFQLKFPESSGEYGEDCNDLKPSHDHQQTQNQLLFSALQHPKLNFEFSSSVVY